MTTEQRKRKREQETKWVEIETAIGNAFSAQPEPDVETLRHWLTNIEQVRPEFRGTLARMMAHPACQ